MLLFRHLFPLVIALFGVNAFFFLKCHFCEKLGYNFLLSSKNIEDYHKFKCKLLMILPLFLTKIREILNIFSSFRLYIEDLSFNLNVL